MNQDTGEREEINNVLYLPEALNNVISEGASTKSHPGYWFLTINREKSFWKARETTIEPCESKQSWRTKDSTNRGKNGINQIFLEQPDTTLHCDSLCWGKRWKGSVFGVHQPHLQQHQQKNVCLSHFGMAKPQKSLPGQGTFFKIPPTSCTKETEPSEYGQPSPRTPVHS